jgi:uncharacterized RDD family membrane protein YckC
MFRSAYLLWKREYRGGGVRFAIFIIMGSTISLALFIVGLAYITGVVGDTGPGAKSYRPVGAGMCIAAAVSMLSFLLAIRSFAHQYEKQSSTNGS